MGEVSSELQPKSAKIGKLISAAGKAANKFWPRNEKSELSLVERIDKKTVAQEILGVNGDEVAPSDITFALGFDSYGKRYREATAKIRGFLQEMVSDGWLKRDDHEMNERGDTSTYPILNREAIEKLVREKNPT